MNLKTYLEPFAALFSSLPPPKRNEHNPLPAPCQKEILEAVERAQMNLFEQRIGDLYWDMPPYLGMHYTSQFYLFLRLLDREHTKLDVERLRGLLLENQLPDGSWYAIQDANIPEGDLNATFLNYFFLKASGTPADSAPLVRARGFILSKGGMAKLSAFNKIVAACFGNYDWEFMPRIPYFVFNKAFPFNHDDFAQWIGPHMVAIAYLREKRFRRFIGPEFLLPELWCDRAQEARIRRQIDARDRLLPDEADQKLIRFMLDRQQPKGSFGGYTLSTMLSTIVFDDFARNRGDPDQKLSIALERAFDFVEHLFFESESAAYLGGLMDGHYWDTALVGIALLTSDIDLEALRPTAHYLVENQSALGGFGYGHDFWYAPDTDDTAEILMFLKPFAGEPVVDRAIERALKWLLSLQSADGGFGAFAKDNVGNWFLNRAAGALADSADLFDESSPDLTGHILEAIADHGHTRTSSPAARRAIAYLKATQSPSGAWWSRWGINYLNGTGAAVVGLVKAGESPHEPYLCRALDWLESRQNPDGGFGESVRAYEDEAWAGRGVSTPSQTAWTLLALIAGGRAKGAAATSAARFLVDELQRDGRWSDRSTVGTGHPCIIYMNYPSYPLTFPLTALARWAKAVGLKVKSGAKRN
jgi:squalene-hopene/tetraprenyl-beta-curcumene cyclase